MRLAVIGDIHVYTLTPPPWALLSKRVLGQANLWLNRRHAFDHKLFDCVLKRVASVEANLLLLSGDLTTTALESEFRDIASRLEPLTQSHKTIAVPGNHDRYTFTSARVKRIEKMLPGFVPETFPKIERLGERWSLLALDGAVPRIFNARGRLGEEQMLRIHEHLSSLTSHDGLVVLCHYPVKCPPKAPPLTYDHKLAESGRLWRMLRRCAARVLYIHGHIHRPWCWQPRHSHSAHITYINAGAPCLTSRRYPLGQGWWQVDLPDDPRKAIHATHHVPDTAGIKLDRKLNGTRTIDKWEARRVM
ncbi:MAG: hypothetical protein GC164_11400 [Phycisphaera sp.]|nr:hypothetical protein [Phycisphaera sp.]